MNDFFFFFFALQVWSKWLTLFVARNFLKFPWNVFFSVRWLILFSIARPVTNWLNIKGKKAQNYEKYKRLFGLTPAIWWLHQTINLVVTLEEWSGDYKNLLVLSTGGQKNLYNIIHGNPPWIGMRRENHQSEQLRRRRLYDRDAVHPASY